MPFSQCLPSLPLATDLKKITRGEILCNQSTSIFTCFQISGCLLWGGGGRQPYGWHLNIFVRQLHRVVVRRLSSGESMLEYWAVAPIAYCIVMLWSVAVYICVLLTFHPYWPLTFIAWFMRVWHVSATIFDCKIYIKYINIYIGI